MKASNNCIELIKKFEGCYMKAYKCPAGVWTIGYGHTAGVKPTDVIDVSIAERYLRSDLIKCENNVMKYYAKYNWNQNQFDALCSFSFNIGSIDQLVQKGNRTIQQISEAMLLYNKANGVVLEGLVRRREEERELFNRGISTVSKSKTGIVTYSLKKDGNKYISDNFKVKEFACKDGSDKILIDVGFVIDKLQDIRNHFGNSVIINSAYRTNSYNEKIGGAKNSYHTKGQAFDIVVKGYTPKQISQYAQILGIKGIIQYPTFVHIDNRCNKYWAVNFKTPKVVDKF